MRVDKNSFSLKKQKKTKKQKNVSLPFIMIKTTCDLPHAC